MGLEKLSRAGMKYPGPFQICFWDPEVRNKKGRENLISKGEKHLCQVAKGFLLKLVFQN